MALTAKDPEKVIAAISTHPRGCVVYNEPLMAFWNRGGEGMEKIPLAAYAFQHFKAVGATGHYQLMIRNERNLPPAPQ